MNDALILAHVAIFVVLGAVVIRRPRILSFTQLSTFSRCPRSYYYAYVRGWKIPPDVAMVDGVAYHHAVEVANRELLANRAHPADDLLDWYDSSVDRQIADGVEIEDDDRRDNRDRAHRIFREYVPNVQDTRIRPRDVERRFETELGGRPFCGVVDLVQEDGTILDYKRTSKKKSPEDVARNPQLHLYQHYLPNSQAQAGHVQFVVRTRPEVALTEVRLDANETNRVLRWAGRVVQGIEAADAAGIWPPCAPDNWVCSRRFCGFYDVCQGFKPEEEMARARLEMAKYLKAALLEDLCPTTVKIVGAQKEKVGRGDDAEVRYVIYVRNDDIPDKGLVLTPTKLDVVCDLCGEDPEDWLGKEITLAIEDVAYGRDTVRGIKVRSPKASD